LDDIWILQRDTVIPWPTLKSPTSATVIRFEPAVAAAVVWNFEPEAPHSRTSSQLDCGWPFAALQQAMHNKNANNAHRFTKRTFSFLIEVHSKFR
jgi:hypothetical protein